MDRQSAAQSGESAVELRDVTKSFGQVVAVKDLNLAIGDSEFFSLLGPSGCGKTTTLRMIAGFEDPTKGEIYLKSRPVAGTPAYKRPVNTVFQSYALFPHMNVYDNVAFGLEMKKVAKEEINSRVLGALELVQLPGMADRKPKQLSGGQQQRVALARALVNQPQVLLLDEPLGALDLKLRKAMQLELKQIQSNVGITFIYVTHDQEEALTMSNRIAVMSLGEVQQVGQPREIYERPANRFVADFIGETNFVEAVVLEPGEPATLAIGKTAIKAAADGRHLSQNQEVTLAIRPEKLSLYMKKRTLEQSWISQDELRQLVGRSELAIRTEGNSKAGERNHIVVPGEVLEVIYIGTDTRYKVKLGDQISLFVRMQNFGARFDTKFDPGDQVYVHWLMENGQVLTN